MFNPAKFAARTLMSGVFVGGGLNAFTNSAALGPMVEQAASGYGLAELPVAGKDLARLNGAGMMAAGTAMALGIAPRLSALSLVGMLVPTTLVGHRFWTIEDPQQKGQEQAAFMSNVALMGGLLMVAMDPK